ncbi:MAG: SDR family oxidoreductase [Candidatus Micrarchaeia archaeon]
MKLEGKTAVVTGGARRIGRAISLALAAEGMNLVVDYNRSRREAKETVREAKALGANAIHIKADVTREKDVESLFKKTLRAFGRVDALVNNAALFERAHIASMPLTSWEKTIQTNLTGVFLCSREAARVMLSQAHGGKIVNIADWTPEQPIKGYSHYSASKAGVVALTRALALELAPKITVNCVAAGTILLPKHYGPTYANTILKSIPLKRFGTPEEVADAVIFLLENDYATGSVLTIDGGRSLV